MKSKTFTAVDRIIHSTSTPPLIATSAKGAAAIDRVVRQKEVCKMLSIGRTQLYELRKRGDFPAGIMLGERAVGWRLSEINDWIARRPTSIV